MLAGKAEDTAPSLTGSRRPPDRPSRANPARAPDPSQRYAAPMDRRILVVAALLAGCPEPPPESGCQLPLVPTIDGTAVSFRVEGCARGDLTARMLGTGNLDLRWAWVDGALVPSVSGGVAGGVLEGLVLEGPVTLQGDDVRLWKQEVPGEVVDVVQRKAAQPRRQRAALAVVWDAQGALEFDRELCLWMDLRKRKNQRIVF